MKEIVAFSIFLVILTGCSDRNSIRITGNIKTKSHNKIYISRIDVDTNSRIDSVRIKNNGNFSFRIKAGVPEFYQVAVSDSDFITLLAAPGEKIKLVFSSKKLYDNYEILGSEGSGKIKMLDEVLADTRRKLDSLRVAYNTASKNPGFDKIEQGINEEYLNVIKGQRKKNIEFVLGNLTSFASLKALYQKIDNNTDVFYDPRDLQFFKLVSDSLNFHYPNSKQAKALKKNLEKRMSQLYMDEIAQAAKNAPEIKLDPNLKDVNGKRIALSSLKGRTVLLTFWVSYSEESTSENLSFKEFYKSYKTKGFEIYQINLDENEDSWKKAVRFDELPWISVREDDPKNPVNARLYNVRSIPYNYLYDKNGSIIGVNLHGQSLQIKLNQIFGN